MANKTHGHDDDAAAPEPLAPQFITLTPEQFAALVPNRADQDAFLKKQAQYTAEAHEHIVNPSNQTHPGISVYSHPEGERAHPKSALQCRIFWVGYEERADELTPTEIDLYNLALPGEYQFTRLDNTKDKLTITGERGPGGQFQRLEFNFRCADEAKDTVPSKVTMLREAFGLEAEHELRAENEALRARLAALGA